MAVNRRLSNLRPGFDHVSGYAGFLVLRVTEAGFVPSTTVFPANFRSIGGSVFINRRRVVWVLTASLNSELKHIRSIVILEPSRAFRLLRILAKKHCR
jgi:hypothetical protein